MMKNEKLEQIVNEMVSLAAKLGPGTFRNIVLKTAELARTLDASLEDNGDTEK